MEFRQLLYVCKVAEEQSFSKAAKKLHIAQPSLSQQIAKLEKELGVSLFDRSKSRIKLTYAGENFFEKATKILDMTEQLKKEMTDVTDLKKGRLIIGTLPITGSYLLPKILPAFRERYPGIDVTLVEETTSELEALTAKGDTDLTLLTLPVQHPQLEWFPLIEEELFLAVPKEHRFVRSGPVSFPELKREPFIMLKRGQGFRHIVLDYCHRAGFEPNVIFESSNIETLQSLVASGMGVTLIPRIIKRSFEPKPVYLKLKDPHPTRTLIFAHRKGRDLSKAAHAFVEMMQTIWKEETS